MMESEVMGNYHASFGERDGETRTGRIVKVRTVPTPLSPLAANIYLHALDRYMESRYLCLPKWQRQQRRRQGKANFLYLRYADDFVVLCNGTKEQAHAMKEELGGLLSSMGLQLSEEKTKGTHITE